MLRPCLPNLLQRVTAHLNGNGETKDRRFVIIWTQRWFQNTSKTPGREVLWLLRFQCILTGTRKRVCGSNKKDPQESLCSSCTCCCRSCCPKVPKWDMLCIALHRSCLLGLALRRKICHVCYRSSASFFGQRESYPNRFPLQVPNAFCGPDESQRSEFLSPTESLDFLEFLGLFRRI